MSQQSSTYLELSEPGGAHKFYEVVVSGTSVAIRYGRIGSQGQTQLSNFATPAQAQAAAKKKINAKIRKGYAPAVQGGRQHPPVTRRTVVSNRSTTPRRTGASSRSRTTPRTAVSSWPTVTQAPVLWRFCSGSPAFGIFVDDERCWVGNENGDVYTLAHDGTVTARYGLPDGVKCLVADDFWIYAGCDDGKVYDLGGKVPHVAYEIATDVDIYWLDIHDGVLGVSDVQGRITTIDHEDEFQWARRSTGDSAWMVRCDDDGVYHGHSRGVTMYDACSGDERWHVATNGPVLFGWHEGDEVFAGTSHNSVQRISKTGALLSTYYCDGAVFSCATSRDGQYVFAGDNNSSVYCFARGGDRLWKLSTGCGSAYSMQFFDDRLYIVTTDGSLACLDASEAAVRAARQGRVPETVSV